jgi:hypothetical protein
LARIDETRHGRKESRPAVFVSAKRLAEHHDFPRLKAFGRIKATREIEGLTSSETRAFALSWTPTPGVLLDTVRANGAIENAPPWQIYVSFREVAARNRKDNRPGSIAVLRRHALALAALTITLLILKPRRATKSNQDTGA